MLDVLRESSRCLRSTFVFRAVSLMPGDEGTVGDSESSQPSVAKSEHTQHSFRGSANIHARGLSRDNGVCLPLSGAMTPEAKAEASLA